ncbi:MAG TPA: dockerin type I domain-containing protein, partial [Pirellulaceae bacterium]|nr:dockerin type I domain-containing protein [Pirellulaceae bacterium]
LDTLQWGTAASATTNALGAYSLAALPAGDYHVRVNPPPNHTVTTYPTGIATLTLGIAQALTGINFGIAFGANPWHNFASNLNVNADPDGVISPVDALMVINWLNSHSTAQLPGQATPQIHGFVDVNNDSLCTPIDALLVINWLNSEQNVPPPAEGEGSAPAFAPAGNLPAAGNSPAEGETSPQTVAEYFAKNPLHFLEIAGDDDLCVHDEHSDLGPTFQAAASQVVPALASTGPISRASSLSGAPLLLAGGSSEIGQRLSTIGQELHDRLEQQLGDSLPRHTLQPVLDRVQGAKETLAVVGDELDEALEAIAPDVSHQWQAALERILRRFPHGLG